MEDLIGKVVDKIRSDVTAADLQWSLFQAALGSYRHDSVLKPFPSALLSDTGQNDEKDFAALVSTAVHLYTEGSTEVLEFYLWEGKAIFILKPMKSHQDQGQVSGGHDLRGLSKHLL